MGKTTMVVLPPMGTVRKRRSDETAVPDLRRAAGRAAAGVGLLVDGEDDLINDN
jgi:hypothetical protein